MEITKKPSKTKKITPFAFYKGKPLARCENIIYYGNPKDKNIVKMEVKASNFNQDLEISSKVFLEMLEVNIKNPKESKSVKSSEKNSLYEALDIAYIWMKRLENF